MRCVMFIIFFLYSLLGVAQHQDKVDFVRAEASILPFPEREAINGYVNYEVKILQDVDSLFVDARNMKFSDILLQRDSVKYSYNEKKLVVYNDFKQGERYFLTLKYFCIPTQTMYFSGWKDDIFGNEQIWTQGQGKYTSHWLPSIDDMEDKVEFDLSLIAPNQDFKVVSNGVKLERDMHLSDSLNVQFDMQKPMSSYLLAFAIGNYKKQVLLSKSGVPIENYYYPHDSSKVEPTYRYTKEIFDFLEEEIGFPYPWQNYKQVPVHDFLYAGMENTGCTIFSDQYVIDSIAFVDKNYVNVNAHEMAHQWFGNLVTEKDGNHHWLHEGFATYYAQLAEKKLFGDDHYYWKLYNTLTQLQEAVARGEGQALTDPKASSLTFYEKGAWALFMLRYKVGDQAFLSGIKNYLESYKFGNATISDFLGAMAKASGKNLSVFREQWLESTQIPFEQSRQLLIDNANSIKLLFELEAELEEAQSDDIDYDKYWKSTNSIYFKQHLLENYGNMLSFETIESAFQSESTQIRQALLKTTLGNDILPKDYLITFLEEDSYVSIEMALFHLWQKHPGDRTFYLDKTKDVTGLPNKNVRLLWLTLAILTNEYEPVKTQAYFDELNGYTGTEHSFEVRQGAFFYLKEAFKLSDDSLVSLIKATNHHTWQFKKFARNLVDELLIEVDYKSRFQKLMNELKEEETRYLKTKFN